MRPRKRNGVPRLSPGPWKLPIIGSIHHLVKFNQHPHHTLRNLGKMHGPLMYLRLGELPFIVISSADAAREIMKTHDRNFCDRPALPTNKYFTYGYKDVVLAPYSAYWRQMRKICVLELLTAKRVESFRFIREEETSNLVKSLFASAGTPLNLTSKPYSLISNIVARAAFGDRSKHQELCLSTVKELMKAAGGFSVTELFPSSRFIHVATGVKSRMEEITRKFDRIFNDIIEEMRLRGRVCNRGGEDSVEDLVDVLLRLQQQGDLQVPFGIVNIKAVIMDVFVAGSDTSSNVLVWAMAELMRKPRAMAKAQEEVRQVLGGGPKVAEVADIQQLRYLKPVIKETLRLHPPLPLLVPRQSMEKCVVMENEIAAQTRVIVNAWAIARDPRSWGEDSESFRPERFLDVSVDYKGTDFEFLPFGAGRRMCPGMAFGLADIELPLAYLLCCFNWELPQWHEIPRFGHDKGIWSYCWVKIRSGFDSNPL